MRTYLEIVKAIREHKKLKYDYEVADLLGITVKSLRSATSRDQIAYKTLLKFCENNPMSADWVFLDRGKPDEPGFDQATLEEKAFLDKVLKVYRNPATKEGLESTVDTMAKVPLPEVKS